MYMKKLIKKVPDKICAMMAVVVKLLIPYTSALCVRN